MLQYKLSHFKRIAFKDVIFHFININSLNLLKYRILLKWLKLVKNVSIISFFFYKLMRKYGQE